MGTAENKQFIRDYFKKVTMGDPTVPDMFADSVTWWVPPGSDMAGLYEGKQAVLGMFAQGIGLYSQTDPMQIDIEDLVAENDTVCAQLVIQAKTAKGKDYKNHYHFVFKVRDGQIHAVKEYVDTQYAHDVLFS